MCFILPKIGFSHSCFQNPFIYPRALLPHPLWIHFIEHEKQRSALMQYNAIFELFGTLESGKGNYPNYEALLSSNLALNSSPSQELYNRICYQWFRIPISISKSAKIWSWKCTNNIPSPVLQQRPASRASLPLSGLVQPEDRLYPSLACEEDSLKYLAS